jgi:hypothetical protein
MKPVLIIDSGAYSVWRRSRPPIPIASYADFLETNAGLIGRDVTLDVIAKDQRADEIEKAAAESARNHQTLKDRGLRPIPVFHEGESFRWLEKMVKEREPWVALAPLKRVPATRSDANDWVTDCFHILSDAKGRPLVRVHGLGITSPMLLHSHKWTSVDSATWAKQSQNGQIPIPKFVDDQFNYTARPGQVSVTQRSRGRRNHIAGIVSDFE